MIGGNTFRSAGKNNGMLASIGERVTKEWQQISGRGRRAAGQPRGNSPNESHGESPLTFWRTTSRAYFQRWLLIGALIGVVAGVGAIAFYAAIAFCTHLFLELGAGFYPPGPAGEGTTLVRPIARPWMLPLLTTLGG